LRRSALRDLGFRNAGTPLLIASTPVSAAHPEEKDRATEDSASEAKTGKAMRVGNTV
jgi:hypothetical protein